MKAFLLSALAAMFLAGCSLSGVATHAVQPQYYILPSPSPISGMHNPAMRLSIMPVQLPGYLDRSKIVIKADEGSWIRVSDYDRWGEDLSDGIARVIGATLSEHGIAAIPLRTGTSSEMKLRLEIRRFDGEPDGNVIIDAVWTVHNDGHELKTGNFVKQRPAGNDIEAMVNSLALLTKDLGKEIAVALR